MGDVVDRSWSAARVRGGAFSAGHRYGGVRAASAHYFSTHGSSRFGAEDAAMSSVCSRENWARKAERGVKILYLSQVNFGDTVVGFTRYTTRDASLYNSALVCFFPFFNGETFTVRSKRERNCVG